MKAAARPFCVIFAFSFLAAFAQVDKDWLSRADKYFEAGEKEKAKECYLKAAELGSAEAHFAVAYRFVVTKEESIFHYSEAAKRGHAEALRYALDGLLFRANSLTLADPQEALEVYETAKKANPSIELFDEEYHLDVMKKCAEAGPFDAEKFIQRSHLSEESGRGAESYDVWELAEEASRGGRFGDPDPRLVFQLISRGGCVPAELGLAVDEFYEHWKKGVVKEFDVCRYVTSGMGQAYCSDRSAGQAEENYQEELRSIISSVDEDAGIFIERPPGRRNSLSKRPGMKKARRPGSGMGQSSIADQRAQFLSTVKRSRMDTFPDVADLAVSDKELNETYRSTVERLAAQPLEGSNFIGVDAQGVRKVQRSWIPYRDRCAALLARLSAAKTEDFWKSWLTQTRTQQLRKILE
jgi:uncharacterized protein YecT (DUF1311 family)/tetratricopeptide (TPR) repeat protein